MPSRRGIPNRPRCRRSCFQRPSHHGLPVGHCSPLRRSGASASYYRPHLLTRRGSRSYCIGAYRNGLRSFGLSWNIRSRFGGSCRSRWCLGAHWCGIARSVRSGTRCLALHRRTRRPWRSLVAGSYSPPQTGREGDRKTQTRLLHAGYASALAHPAANLATRHLGAGRALRGAGGLLFAHAYPRFLRPDRSG